MGETDCGNRNAVFCDEINSDNGCILLDSVLVNYTCSLVCTEDNCNSDVPVYTPTTKTPTTTTTTTTVNTHNSQSSGDDAGTDGYILIGAASILIFVIGVCWIFSGSRKRRRNSTEMSSVPQDFPHQKISIASDSDTP